MKGGQPLAPATARLFIAGTSPPAVPEYSHRRISLLSHQHHHSLNRARYGYGTSVSDKEGRGDDQMRCSCLIRGHPRGGLCLPFILLCAELDPYTKRGGAAHPV